ALEVPVVGGNVSLYNEGTEGPIYPTPVVGMVGALPDPGRAGRLAFAHAGEAIAIVGVFDPALAGGELAKLRGEALPSGRPALDRLAGRIPLEVLGTVGGGALEVAVGEWRFAATVAELREAHNALGGLFP